MSSLAFDSLKFARRLKEAGVPEQQAEAQAEVMAETFGFYVDNLVTRDYLDDANVNGGQMDLWSAGLNWPLNPYMTVNFNYRYINLLRDGIEGTSQGFNARVVLVLE